MGMVLTMTKLEQLFILLLGFLIFEIIFIRLGFAISIEINSYTLPISWTFYTAAAGITYSFFRQQSTTKYISLLLFIIISLILYAISFLFTYTYDTSWDGQGYNQTGVIALARGWNPLFEPSINFGYELPSQIFAEGYPSALWELQASVYGNIGRINSAQILNLLIGIIAWITTYSLLRKLSLKKTLSGVISILLVLQPIYIIQLLTFMQDGFGYQLLLTGISCLIILSIYSQSYWALVGFIFAELLMVTTKYSYLPIALVLGLVFILIVGNRILNKEYTFSLLTKFLLIGLILICIIFSHLPYIKNIIFHSAPFYPVNQTELMGSIKYNNVPLNLKDNNKVSLLFYGIFSQSQSLGSGNEKSDENVAYLKVPFMFSRQEILDSARLYNNRVGAGGPLFSGIFVLTFILLVISSLKVDSRKERYALYSSYFCLTAILATSLLAPTPNLLRYVNQLQIIPFAVCIPLYVYLHYKYIKILSCLILIAVSINTSLFLSAVIYKTIDETNQMNSQFSLMKKNTQTYQVRAEQFYSNFIQLNEQDIKFLAVKSLTCTNPEKLYASSNTTHFCD